MNTEPSPKALNDINQDFETRAAEARAHSFGIKYIDLLTYPLNPDVLKLVGSDDSRVAKAIPFYKNGRQVRLATVNPQTELVADMVSRLEKNNYQVELWLCSDSGFDRAFLNYASHLVQRKEVKVRHDFNEKVNVDAEEQFKGFANLISTLELVPVNKALNEIEIAAIQAKASDIHLQPYEKKGELRFRIDGILHTVGDLSAEKTQKIIGQIKYEAGMKANITDIPQDGHITFVANDRKIDLRVSSLPTEYNESIVMRVLDSGRGIKSFSELGFDSYKEQKILEVLKKKNGMVLVTGPTGSGKTTTLYAMLTELNDPSRKLVTLEDPIEYHLEEVTQSQVSSQGDYNFGSGLKALLRHDPDVILIGEIRDLETAKLAAEAALTGHVVLSSLHTNSALGAITRMRNLGLESFNVSSSVNAIFAQRLVRRVCPDCRTTQIFDMNSDPRFKAALERLLIAEPTLRDKLKFVDEQSTDQVHRSKHMLELVDTKPDGDKSGYEGQTVLAEVVFLDDELRQKVANDENEANLEAFEKKRNPQFLTLFEDGIKKVILGETTLVEIYRVAG